MGNMTLLTDNGVTLLGQNLSVKNQHIDLGQGDLVEGGYIDHTTVDTSQKTKTTDLTVGIRHVAVDAAIAVNNAAKAAEAVKAAKDDYNQARQDHAAGKISSEALNDYKINLAAATANLAQSGIALAGALQSTQTTAWSGGFKASGTLTNTETTNSTSNTTQNWTGTTHTVSGNSSIVSDLGKDGKAKGKIDLTGSTFQVKGESYYDIAGVDAKAAKLTHSSSSKSKSNSQSATMDSGGGVGGSISHQSSQSQSSQTQHIGSQVDLGNATGNLGDLRSIGSNIHLTVEDPSQITINSMTVQSLQDQTRSSNSSRGGSLGLGTTTTNGKTSLSSGSASFNKSQGSEDTLQTNQIASITIGGQANLDTMGVKHISNTGGIIANATPTIDPVTGQTTYIDQGQLTYSGPLDLKDLKDHSYVKQNGINIATSISKGQMNEKGKDGNPIVVGKTAQGQDIYKTKTVIGGTTTLGMSNNGHTIERTVQASMGQGNVTAANEESNRDINNTILTTKDQVTGALNANVNIDNRYFSANGREQIGDEIEKLPENLKRNAAMLGVGGLIPGSIFAGLIDDKEGSNIDKAVANVKQTTNNENTGSHKETTELVATVQEIEKGEEGRLTNVVDNQATLNALNDKLAAGTKASSTDISLTSKTTNAQGQRVQETTNIGNSKDTFLDLNHLDKSVDNINHAIAHQNGQGETSASLQGTLATWAFRLGAWANSDAINTAQANITAAPITSSNNARAQLALLTSNNAKLKAQQAVGDEFEDQKVFKWVDAYGVTHYGNTPPPNANLTTFDTNTGETKEALNAVQQQQQKIAEDKKRAEIRAAWDAKQAKSEWDAAGKPKPETQSAQAERTALDALFNLALDLSPVGDVKAFIEAQSPYDYLLASVGVLPLVGDLPKLLKEAKVLSQAGDSVGAAEKLKGAADIVNGFNKQTVLDNIAASKAGTASSKFDVQKAYDFYIGEAGFSSKVAKRQVDAIDVSNPVNKVILQPNGISYVQHVANGKVGNYFAPDGTPADVLGINPTGRIPITFKPTKPTTALKSTAKDVTDTWTVPENPYPAKGGGTQLFVPQKGNMQQVSKP
jgi:Bacterial toxin 46/Domain of unknown function (DUF4124)